MPRRHDVLAAWLAHRQITPRQAEAGRRFRDLFDVSGLEGHAIIDPTGPMVTLAERSRGVASARMMAQSELQAIRPILGAFDFALVSRVIGAGQDIAGHILPGGNADGNASSDAEKRYLAHRIRDALSLLATRL